MCENESIDINFMSYKPHINNVILGQSLVLKEPKMPLYYEKDGVLLFNGKRI